MQELRLHWTAKLWPGLPQLWNRGSWAGLAVAVGFTVLANGLLTASLVFTEWLTSEVRLTGLGVLAIVWLAAWWLSRGEGTQGEVDMPDEQSGLSAELRDQLFREAQQRYLENDWVATEQLLLKLLKQDVRDVESRLMLATLWRHQGRGEEALGQLDQMERLEAADQWKYEIEVEREAIAGIVRKNEIEIIEETSIHDTNRRMAA